MMISILNQTDFMIEIPNKIDKAELADKPRVTFDGIIDEIDTLEKAENAVGILSEYRVLGFDTETRPSFTRGLTHKISLLQLSAEDHAWLFRLNRIGIPDCVAGLLENPDILKIGVSVKDDLSQLAGRRAMKTAGFVELQQMCKSMGIEEMGLQKMYGLLFGERISKNQQLSNWEIEHLTEGQRQYAAIDAWACLRIYGYLTELRRSGQYTIIKKDAEESNTQEG
mgnify:CR=1 FL=1